MKLRSIGPIFLFTVPLTDVSCLLMTKLLLCRSLGGKMIFHTFWAMASAWRAHPCTSLCHHQGWSGWQQFQRGDWGTWAAVGDCHYSRLKGSSSLQYGHCLKEKFWPPPSVYWIHIPFSGIVPFKIQHFIQFYSFWIWKLDRYLVFGPCLFWYRQLNQCHGFH